MNLDPSPLKSCPLCEAKPRLITPAGLEPYVSCICGLDLSPEDWAALARQSDLDEARATIGDLEREYRQMMTTVARQELELIALRREACEIMREMMRTVHNCCDCLEYAYRRDKDGNVIEGVDGTTRARAFIKKHREGK